MEKKGESQHIATVLLVAFIIAILIVVFLWGRNYIQERAEKEGKLAEKQLECEGLGIEIINAYQQGSKVIVTLKNTKEREVGKFIFRIIGDEIEIIESFDKLDSLSIKQYQLEFTENVGTPSRVNIIPWLKVVRGYYVPCSHKNIEIKLN